MKAKSKETTPQIVAASASAAVAGEEPDLVSRKSISPQRRVNFFNSFCCMMPQTFNVTTYFGNYPPDGRPTDCPWQNSCDYCCAAYCGYNKWCVNRCGEKSCDWVLMKVTMMANDDV